MHPGRSRGAVPIPRDVATGHQAGLGGSPGQAERTGTACQRLHSPGGQRSSHACCSRAPFLSKSLQPRGSARLTAWRLFIRRQRQRELLADAAAFVLQGSLLPASCLRPISPGFPPPHPDAPSKRKEASGGVPSLGFPAPMPTVPWQGSPQGPGTQGHRAAATLSLPQQPSASSSQAKALEVAPQRWRGQEEGGHPSIYPWALLLSTVPARVGGTSETRPPRPLPGESLAAGAGTGTSLGGRWPPSTSGKGTIPGHFFFGRPLVPPLCTPPSSSRARARGHN